MSDLFKAPPPFLIHLHHTRKPTIAADMASRGIFRYTKVLPCLVSGPLGTATGSAAAIESVSCAGDENNADSIQSNVTSRSGTLENGRGPCM